MGSNRDYKSIRYRYKQHHDPILLRNASRVLTQQEERTLGKLVDISPGGTVRYRKGFEAAATQLKLPVEHAKKRFVLITYITYLCIFNDESMALYRFCNNGSTKRTRRCWFVGCDITQESRPEDVKLISLPKKEPFRTKWWLRMGRRRDEPIPSNAKCCSQHLNMSIPKKHRLPIIGIANSIRNTSRRVGAVNMDAASVAQRTTSC